MCADVGGTARRRRRLRSHHQRGAASRRLLSAATGRPDNEHHRVEAGSVGFDVDVGRIECGGFLAAGRLGGRFSAAQADDPQSAGIQSSGSHAQSGAGTRSFGSHRPTGISLLFIDFFLFFFCLDC